jgi:hypothetical protein
VRRLAAAREQNNVAAAWPLDRFGVFGNVAPECLRVLRARIVVGREIETVIAEPVGREQEARHGTGVSQAYVAAFQGATQSFGNAESRKDSANDTRRETVVRFVENPSTSNSIGPRSIVFGVPCSTTS